MHREEKFFRPAIQVIKAVVMTEFNNPQTFIVVPNSKSLFISYFHPTFEKYAITVNDKEIGNKYEVIIKLSSKASIGIQNSVAFETQWEGDYDNHPKIFISPNGQYFAFAHNNKNEKNDDQVVQLQITEIGYKT